MSHQEDPVLATWRFGLGRAAAFTSDAKAKWAVLWLRWGNFNKFWAQLTRWTLRSGTRSETTAAVQRIDTTGEVLVDAVDAKGEFINFLDSQVRRGGAQPRAVGHRARAGGARALPRPLPGPRRGRVPGRHGPAEGRSRDRLAARRLVVPYASELRDLGVDETLLRELAELTGGGPLEASEGRVPQGPAPVEDRRRDLAVAGRARRVPADFPIVAVRRLGPGGFRPAGSGVAPAQLASPARGQRGRRRRAHDA